MWEVGTGLCKAAVTVLFTAPMLPTHQALTLVVVLSLALLSQRIFRPYEELLCNRVALLSLLLDGGCFLHQRHTTPYDVLERKD